MIADVARRVPDSLRAYRDGVAAGPGGPASVPLVALRDPAVFDAALSAFGAGLGAVSAGVDRRALVSYWSQFYFAALATPALTALVRLGRPLPLAFDTTSLELDAQGRPLRLLVEPDAPDQAPGLAGLIAEHLHPFVDLCHARCGLAPRVLWGNAAVIFDHVARELGETDAPACAEIGACLGWCPGPACAKALSADVEAGSAQESAPQALSADVEAGSASGGASRQRPKDVIRSDRGGHGSGSPLARALCAGPSGCRRRTCCLRQRLPGVPSCGALCPLECATGRCPESRC
ncbi:siderophore-iron reductase FhuF [Methylobacterium symbioticum]|uniref:Aerobactin siderophore biosynthesis IucA/IucC-like C-terminal domain-containing protein n=1 Tax=Methylobacterium symbioticum TaxID=2584084 RepID=A0A509E8T3_9HYPH|nr:siderophore-iron reductase FhuF [Methylobacterium symbioticum]VUD70508.1 hypothetical protein MET9862_01077 [Methylobacterium symbioticum]